MTLKYMLDTDSVSYALRGKGNVGARILQHKPSELCISSVTLGELRFGGHKSNSKKLHKLIDTFTASVVPRDFDIEAADEYGRVAADLAKAGTPIGAFDTMIGAHALAKKLIVVTNNARHFSRVKGLKIENWTDDDPDAA
jgi:tRNA(fMet)-specific endonuclease VapC